MVCRSVRGFCFPGPCTWTGEGKCVLTVRVTNAWPCALCSFGFALFRLWESWLIFLGGRAPGDIFSPVAAGEWTSQACSLVLRLSRAAGSEDLPSKLQSKVSNLHSMTKQSQHCVDSQWGVKMRISPSANSRRWFLSLQEDPCPPGPGSHVSMDVILSVPSCNSQGSRRMLRSWVLSTPLPSWLGKGNNSETSEKLLLVT